MSLELDGVGLVGLYVSARRNSDTPLLPLFCIMALQLRTLSECSLPGWYLGTARSDQAKGPLRRLLAVGGLLRDVFEPTRARPSLVGTQAPIPIG